MKQGNARIGSGASSRSRAIRSAAISSFAAACMATSALLPSAAAAQDEQSQTAEEYDPRDYSGIWLVTNGTSSRIPVEKRITRRLDGSPVPLRPEYQKIYDERIAIARDPSEAYADSEARCLPSGVPRIMRGTGYPMQILQTPGQITMLFEALATFRIIHMDQEQADPEDLDPTWMGHAVGRWEGDKLIVDTIGRNDKTEIDKIGLPHSDQLHVIEEYNRTGPDNFEILMTIDDPGAYTEKWQILAQYERAPEGTELYEFICNEHNTLVVREDGTHGSAGETLMEGEYATDEGSE